MIAKDSTSAVNFLVLDTDGFPATGQASNITATISINGATATSISDTITEKGSGWYYFNHTFGTAGNAFITFTAANCVIMPWEEEVVEMASGSLTAQQVWEYSGGRTITNTIPSAANIADAVWDEDITAHIDTRNKPLGYMVFYMDYIPQSVWGYSVKYVSLSQNTITDIWSMSTFPDEDDIAARVWGRTRNAAPTRTLTAATLSNGSLSTFDPLNDTVLIDSTQAATMVTATGFATPSDLSGLSTFNPSTDKVTLNTTEDTTLSAIKTKVDTLQNADLSTIAKSSEITALQTYGNEHWATATGFATPSDLSGLATATNVSTAQSAIITQGNTAWITATGFATPSDIPASDITAIKTKVDTLHNTDLTGIATSANVSTAQAAIIDHGDENWIGGGTGGATAQQIWEYPNRTITAATLPNNASLATAANISAAITDIENYGQQHWITATGFSTFDPATDTVLIDSTQAASMATATGFATPADITDSQADIIAAVNGIDISSLATSTEVAVLADLQKDLNAGVLNWSVTANALTIYNDNNSIRATYTLTRDEEGNITRIQPNS